MKRIHVNANCTALVFKNNALKRVLSAGSHWLYFGETVSYCDMTQLPNAHPNLDEWLQHKDFAGRVTVLEVKDNQLVLLYRSGNFKALLKPGKYAIWKGIYGYDCVWADLDNYEIGADIDRNLLDKSTFAPYVRGAK